MGKKPKKIHARENAKKKNSCKDEGKEKKFMQKEGPIVTFSESLSSEINNITRHNMNKQCTCNIHCILYYNKYNKIKFVINKY